MHVFNRPVVQDIPEVLLIFHPVCSILFEDNLGYSFVREYVCECRCVCVRIGW